MATELHAVFTKQSSNAARLYCFALAIVIFADLIGPLTVNIGVGKIVLLPMIWAIVMGGAFGLVRGAMPSLLKLDIALQFKSAAILQVGLLLFTAKLGLMVGSALPALGRAGWTLVFQEAGHFVGTIVMGLPLALLLGIKREAIGATFSVGREPSLAIIGEKYGMDSPEGRGVLAEYLTGTLFGTIFIAVLAGVIASWGIFDPIALAMGAGVGSGSMMAAAASAIAALQTPDLAKTVTTFAAASNLLTSLTGTYVTLFISLPVAAWLYRILEPKIGRIFRQSAAPNNIDMLTAPEGADKLTFMQRLVAWGAVAILALLGGKILLNTRLDAAIPGMLVILACVFVGHGLATLTGRRVPAVCVVSVVAMFLSSPAFPWADKIAALTNKVDFLAMATPLLTFAGLSVAKDVPTFRRLGWRIILVSFIANAGTFLGATVVAQIFVH